MKKSWSLLFTCLILLGFIFPTQAQTTHYEYEFNDNLLIESFDGTTIAANIFIPLSSEPDAVFPAIIFPNSWALDEYEYLIQAARFAEKGYIVLSYSARGWGASEGLINVAGPDDMADITAIIDWLSANTPVAEQNIGMGGISYGAGISLLGAAHDGRVKTVVSMSGWGDVADALYGNETPRLVWGGILVGTGYIFGNMDPVIEEKYLNLLTHTDIEETLAWASERSPLTYIDQLNNRQVPIYISQNFQDELFQPNSLMALYAQLTYPHKHMDINLGIHATGEGGGLIGLPNEVWDNAHDWFDYWLKDIDTGIMNRNPVTMQIKNTEERQQFEDWPSTLIQTNTYYLGRRGFFSNGSLNETPQASSYTNHIHTGILSGATTGVPVLSPFFEAHTAWDVFAWVPAINRSIAIVYESTPLPSDLLIAGIPSLSLQITPSSSEAQLIAHLYDMDEWGVGTLITHGPLTLHETIPGEKIDISLDFVATAYQVPQGHKLVLAIDTYDPQYGVPTLDPYHIKFHYDESDLLQLQIPYVN